MRALLIILKLPVSNQSHLSIKHSERIGFNFLQCIFLGFINAIPKFIHCLRLDFLYLPKKKYCFSGENDREKIVSPRVKFPIHKKTG